MKNKNTKWFILLAIAVILGAAVAVKSCVERVKADITVSYIGESYFDSELFYENSSLLDEAVGDVNGDGKINTEIVVISIGTSLTSSQEQANLAKMSVSMGQGESRVYLMDKVYCQRYADEEILADLSDFRADSSVTDVLVNSSGKVYGISVEGNPLVEKLGLSDTKDVYLALRSVTEMDSVNFKNIEKIDEAAKNTAKLIISNNKK